MGEKGGQIDRAASRSRKPDAQVVDVVERPFVLAPAGRADRDEAVVRAFLGENDRVRPPEGGTMSSVSACNRGERNELT